MLLRRFFRLSLEPAMNRMLTIALTAACLINLVSLFGHL